MRRPESRRKPSCKDWRSWPSTGEGRPPLARPRPSMNSCHLLPVLVGKPAEDRRARPDLLNRTVATVTDPPRNLRSCLQEPAGHRGRTHGPGAVGWLTRQAKEMTVTTTTPGIQVQPGGQPRLAAGRWRGGPAFSQASFIPRGAGRGVRGCPPPTREGPVNPPVAE